MGGFGSGCRYHWWRHGKKTTVEECLRLDANRWRRERIIQAGAYHVGTWRWTYRSGSGFSVNYEMDARDLARPFVRLWYSWTFGTSKELQSADYRVDLTMTRLRNGGVRWWFVCPLVVGGRPCERRAGKLYLPGHARYFGCRRCHDLTYTSCQESGK